MASQFSLKQADVGAAVSASSAAQTVTFASTPTAGDLLWLELDSTVLASTNVPTISDGAGGTWTQIANGISYNGLEGASAVGGSYLSVWYRFVGASETWATKTVTVGAVSTPYTGTIVCREITGFAGTGALDASIKGASGNTNTSSPLTTTLAQFTNSGTHAILSTYTRSVNGTISATFADIPAGSTGAGTPGALTVVKQFGSSLYDGYGDGINDTGGNAVVWTNSASSKSVSVTAAFADITGGGTVTSAGARSRIRLRSRHGSTQISESYGNSRSIIRLRSRPVGPEVSKASNLAIFGLAIWGDAIFGYAASGFVEISASRSVIRFRSRPASVFGTANSSGARSIVRLRSRPGTAAIVVNFSGSGARARIRLRSRPGTAAVVVNFSGGGARSRFRLRSRAGKLTASVTATSRRTIIRFRSRAAQVSGVDLCASGTVTVVTYFAEVDVETSFATATVVTSQ